MVRVYSADWLSKNIVRVDCKVTEKDRCLYSISCLCIDENISEVHCSVLTFAPAYGVGHDIAMAINNSLLIASRQAYPADFVDSKIF